MRKKSFLLAAIMIFATSTPVWATTCVSHAGQEFDGTVKYTDRTLSENYLERGGSEDTDLKKFYIANGTVGRRIDDLKISVFDDDGNLVAKTQRGPNISANSGIAGSANSMAVFYVPWDNFDWRLQIGYRWEKSSRHFTYLRNAYKYTYQDGVQLIKDATPDPEPDWIKECR